MVADSIFEQFIEIKVVLHQKVDVAAVKLHNLLVHDCASWPTVKVKWSAHVNTTLRVPFECTDSELKSIHSCATVFEFLIGVFNGIIIISFIIIADGQS